MTKAELFELFEQNTPKQVDLYKGHYECPDCAKLMFKKPAHEIDLRTEYLPNYCDMCGQRLAWEFVMELSGQWREEYTNNKHKAEQNEPFA